MQSNVVFPVGLHAYFWNRKIFYQEARIRRKLWNIQCAMLKINQCQKTMLIIKRIIRINKQLSVTNTVKKKKGNVLGFHNGKPMFSTFAHPDSHTTCQDSPLRLSWVSWGVEHCKHTAAPGTSCSKVNRNGPKVSISYGALHCMGWQRPRCLKVCVICCSIHTIYT